MGLSNQQIRSLIDRKLNKKVKTVDKCKKYSQRLKAITKSLPKLRKLKKYSVEEVLDRVLFVNKKEGKRMFDGDLIKMTSDRYKTFKLKGIKCVGCGIKGQFFYKEKHIPENPYHFNLYALDKDGNEVLMTKDHIVPISKGGKNNVKNYQTMCTICNQEKKAKDDENFKEIKRKEKENVT